jgi:hypothetical protein
MNDKPLCKVAIGSAYQRPLRRDFTPEEIFWQARLLDKREGLTASQVISSVLQLLMWLSCAGVLIWLA